MDQKRVEHEIFEFIEQNRLSPFNLYKTPIDNKAENIFKTRDGKNVHTKVIRKISDCFCFSDTSNILNCFSFTKSSDEIIKRQEFFRNIKSGLENDFLKELKKPKPVWGPKYGIVAVTDNEDTFSKLKEIDIPVKFLLNEDDIADLENYDIVQVVDVENFSSLLEQLPQSVFLDSIEDVYLERYLEILSGWAENFNVLSKVDSVEVKQIISDLNPLLNLIDIKGRKKISRVEIEEIVNKMNEEVSIKVKELNVSGESLFNMLSQNKLPTQLEKIIDDVIKHSTIASQLLIEGIPIKINEEEFEEFIKIQDANEHTDFAEKIKKNSKALKEVPKKLERLSALILFYDFCSGISKFVTDKPDFPNPSVEFIIEKAKNIFLENPQEISFNLDENSRCSILTGANSGGKTTLIEHIIQIISLFNLGLPIYGSVKSPIFSEIYYFAKNKGSASKGAFETLLTQMSEVNPGKNTLILADEIEAVTEPGVAGKIISATAKYFIEKNCFLIIATHLGYEIKDILPEKSRIDGIFARGLDSNNELIVDHSPVIGKLANSTPELIVEKMSNNGGDYFIYLNKFLKGNSSLN